MCVFWGGHTHIQTNTGSLKIYICLTQYFLKLVDNGKNILVHILLGIHREKSVLNIVVISFKKTNI